MRLTSVQVTAEDELEFMARRCLSGQLQRPPISAHRTAG